MAAKYASDDPGESDRPMRVCAEAGRKCVRNIHQYRVLSLEWIQLVDSLKQLTRLVELEGRMPANAKVTEAAGRNVESEGTLWDQEGHENAIRILVEEAKVNLCLRIMNDYKVWQYGTDRRVAFAQAMQEHGGSWNEAQLDQKCRQFEESLGVLLWRALVHVEALQLMDIPLLIEHIALVLWHCYEQAEAVEHGGKDQEMIAMYYVSSLFTHAESLNNTELLAKVRELLILPRVVPHITTHAYPEEFAFAVALGLAALCDNEDFKTDWKTFFSTPDGELDHDQMVAFVKLQEWVIPMLTSPDRKRELRPLTDFFNTLSRKMG